MKKHIYADNAATTALDLDAFEAMKPWLLDEYGNASQPYSFSRKPKEAITKARETIAECIHARPEEVFFTSGGTESDNWAIKGVAISKNTDHEIITSAIEHHAVLRACEAVEHQGVQVSYMLPNSDGTITPNILESYITDDTSLVSVMLANNELGSIQPIKNLCKIAHGHGSLFHTDAVQAVGHIDIDVNDLGIDLLSASAHKFNGPKGIGFLYIRDDKAISPFMHGGAQELGLRAGTENVASIVGMAVALKNNCSTIKINKERVTVLEKILLSILYEHKVPFVRNGGSNTLPGIISLSFAGKDGEAILHRMDLLGISISTGSACDSKNTEISHVLKAINCPENLAKGTVRISLGRQNTEEDVEAIANALIKSVSK